ncbi:MAG: hypothetical protein KA160_04445 [Lacibacter sp.]|nr:hypothetical protein [Lacibacter sp.]
MRSYIFFKGKVISDFFKTPVSYIFLLTLAGLLSCKKNKNGKISPVTTSIYIAGTIGSSAPFLFKDDIPLPPITTRYGNAQLSGLDIAANGDVYTCGTEEFFEPTIPANYIFAAFWKNGIRQPFSIEPGNSSGANDIKVIGTDVYLAGSNDGKAVVWKNGIPTNLTSGARWAFSSSVFVNGNDIYTAINELNLSNNFVPKIWKNGVQMSILTDGTYSTQITAIVINGVDVYGCGFERNSLSAIDRPVLWKNAVKSYLGTNAGTATSLFVSNNDVYVSGHEYITGTPRHLAKYWKNGAPVVLGQGYSSSINSIYVKDEVIYCAGFEKTLAGSRSVPKYWKNGVATILSDGSQNAVVKSIVVK